ncbi:helix-turn-helix domain-containing protein [Streptomyces sp. ODS28]|uniref:TetR/AcrR family transcriptional regulator n=1 Tax=Streptomyces sp. ODS28 TaxID=3136688 RepID=UPI0031E94DD4
MGNPDGSGQTQTLRERKRARTRQALIDAAVELFERDGYDETTVAAIAARAEIGTRTFFSHFSSKEELLFPDTDARVQAALHAIATRAADERPADVLLRALRNVAETDFGVVGELTRVRMRLIQTVPVVRGRALQLQREAERTIARRLHGAFPDELDEVEAAALVGAFVGAVSGALQALLDSPEALSRDAGRLGERVREATDVALRPWRDRSGPR